MTTATRRIETVLEAFDQTYKAPGKQKT